MLRDLGHGQHRHVARTARPDRRLAQSLVRTADTLPQHRVHRQHPDGRYRRRMDERPGVDVTAVAGPRRDAARRPLPAGPGAGPRRDVDGLPGHGHPAGPPGRGQGDGPAAGRRSGVPGPVRARGPLRGPDRPSGRRRTCTTRARALLGDGEPVVFLVMELVEGGTLRDVLRARGALAVPAAVAVLEPVLAGLARGAPARARAPRRQAGERADQPHRRGQGGRLRAGHRRRAGRCQPRRA